MDVVGQNLVHPISTSRIWCRPIRRQNALPPIGHLSDMLRLAEVCLKASSYLIRSVSMVRCGWEALETEQTTLATFLNASPDCGCLGKSAGWVSRKRPHG